MPVQHSPPANNTRSHRHQAVLTPAERAPLDCTTSVNQLSENLDRVPPIEGAEPSRRGGVKSGISRSFSVLLGGYQSISQGPRRRSGEAEDEEGEGSVEKEESEETEVEAALAGPPEASEAANIAPFNQPLLSQAEQKFLKMMEQMTEFMGQLTQEVSPREISRAPAFKTPSMKAPDSFDGRARKWIEPCLSNISNEDPSYLLNNWKLFETLLFTLFGVPNEFRKAEQEIENLRMKESGQASLYIADFRSLIFKWDFFLIDSPKGEDLILGYDFLNYFIPIIDWKNGLITYDSSHKDSSGIIFSTTNELATSVNSVALVSELNTPSLPPSVNISSIIPSQ
ncbi:hypothetical protein O181_017894 [Austropuccinia psidii MF-1]|uniref:Retrotransposon gag domain-containing protein n=1 Tax=Austropuccinia psidii MF-1 TaxID=1389203 RepID=A0A9Q3GT84_9BASI|nr:hypothetical protein [Austropuccinia psidii MF-1]